jgi:hypothetical protein
MMVEKRQEQARWMQEQLALFPPPKIAGGPSGEYLGVGGWFLVSVTGIVTRALHERDLGRGTVRVSKTSESE